VYAEKDKIVEATPVGVYYLARSESQKKMGKKENIDLGEKYDADINGKIVSRFEKF
jgi:hypothetical protein